MVEVGRPSHPERTGTQVRIGVAIEVPEPYSSQLRAARRRFGDPEAEAIPPHITVLGPTVLEPGEVERAMAHLESAVRTVEPFEVVLSGAGSFRPVSPVVFAQVAQGIAECEALESAVRAGVLDLPTRFYYHPHVTVAHEVPDEALDRAFLDMAGFEASFHVGQVHLFEHGDDSVWRPVRGFALGRSNPGTPS